MSQLTEYIKDLSKCNQPNIKNYYEWFSKNLKMNLHISDFDNDFIESLDPNDLSDQESEYLDSICENEDF